MILNKRKRSYIEDYHSEDNRYYLLCQKKRLEGYLEALFDNGNINKGQLNILKNDIQDNDNQREYDFLLKID